MVRRDVLWLLTMPNGLEPETLGELARQVGQLRTEVGSLRTELKAGFVTQDLYRAAHTDLEDRVHEARADLAELAKAVKSRPSWGVSMAITFLSALDTALLTAVFMLLR